jgi:hypothetical protein
LRWGEKRQAGMPALPGGLRLNQNKKRGARRLPKRYSHEEDRESWWFKV